MKFKEQFNDIITPLKYLDSKISRTYQKVSRKIPDKKLYKITTGLMYSSIVGTCTWLSPPFENRTGLSGGTSAIFLQGADNILNHCGLMGDLKNEEETSENLALDPNIYLFKSYNKQIRFPVLATGITLLGKAAYNAFNYFDSGQPSLYEVLDDIREGLGFLALASSMYLKDRNPKLLEKQPMWKDVLNLAKKGYEKLTSPIPQPATVEAYSSLDDKLI